MTTDFVLALGANIRHLDATAQKYMPNMAYKTFYSWALTTDNPQQAAWLQVIGLVQLVKMTYQLLGGLVRDEDWNVLLGDSLMMNGYQIYEIISDNIAIGITHEGSEKLREAVLLFNRAMVQRLTQSKVITIEYLNAFTKDISSFLQSLSPQKQADIAQIFTRQCPEYRLHDIEYNVSSLLLANIETCYDLYRACDALIGGKIVQDGLVARYKAVNDILVRENMPYERRISMSADAILVTPTLGYYIAVIAEKIYKLPKFADVVASGQLAQTLNDAALVVRLLNDMGSLTKGSSEARQKVLDNLALVAQHHDGMTLKESVIQSNLGAQITRLQKDVIFGEWNLALHDLDNLPVNPETLQLFSERLVYLSDVYKTTYKQMENGLIEIEKQLEHKLVSSIVRRFVEFHVQLYSNDYKGETGEYAI